MPKNADAFDVKDTMFGHETDVDKKLEEYNDEKKGEPCSPSSSSSLSKRKETEEPMKAASHQEGTEDRSPNREEYEPVHVEPNNSTFSVEEVQSRFGDSQTATFETQITEKVQSVAANKMKSGNNTTENDDGLSSADADKY